MRVLSTVVGILRRGAYVLRGVLKAATVLLRVEGQMTSFFITRAKSNFRFKRLYSHPVDKTTGLLSDQTIVLKGFYAKKDYPEKLRRIRFYDAAHQKYLVF